MILGVSGPIVSLALRMPEIKFRMADDEWFVSQFQAAFAVSLDFRKAAVRLQINLHPDLQCIAGRRGGGSRRLHHASTWAAALRLCLYRCDRESQFTDFADARKVNNQVVSAKRKRVECLQAPDRKALTHGNIARECMLDHIRATCSKDAYYCLPLAALQPGDLQALAECQEGIAKRRRILQLLHTPGAARRPSEFSQTLKLYSST